MKNDDEEDMTTNMKMTFPFAKDTLSCDTNYIPPPPLLQNL